MERKEFLSLMGFTGLSVLATMCLGACSKQSANNGVVAAGNADFTLDISLPANAALAAAGSYLYSNGAIVAHTVGKLHSCFAGIYTPGCYYKLSKCKPPVLLPIAWSHFFRNRYCNGGSSKWSIKAVPNYFNW